MNENIQILETKIKNLTYIVMIGFIVVILLIAGLYIKGTGTKSTSTSTASSSSSSSTEYDVSRMTKITGSDAVKLFDDAGTHILYIGRPTCSVCVQLVPQLNETIDELKVSVNYLELTSSFRTDWAGLFDKLTIKTTVNKEEGTFGELLEQYGYTPVIIVIQDGKMVDGFIGYRDSEAITSLFKKYL